MSQRRPNGWELVVNLGREVRPTLRSIPARAGFPCGTKVRPMVGPTTSSGILLTTMVKVMITSS